MADDGTESDGVTVNTGRKDGRAVAGGTMAAIRSYFHDPDICLPVVRRRFGEALLDLVAWYAMLPAPGGFWQPSYQSKIAHSCATYRLRKAGLLAYKNGSKRILELTDLGEKEILRTLKPQRFWNQKWNGIWDIMVYDIVEEERALRDNLRGFLKRLRMGGLQRSVWVSVRDIRPEYDDLMRTVSIQFECFLFESKTVLGQGPDSVVNSAWNWDRIDQIQSHYLRTYEHNLGIVREDKLRGNELRTIARDEISAYLSAMEEDPLLPKELLPNGYLGKKVYELHKTFVRDVAYRLKRVK